jgi:hypothetical protein
VPTTVLPVTAADHPTDPTDPTDPTLTDPNPADVRGVIAALRETTLAGHQVEDGLGDTVLVHDVAPDRIAEAWRAARSVLPVTGRWPVFTAVGGLYGEPDDAELAELHRAALGVDPWSVFYRLPNDEPVPHDRFEHYVRACLGADLLTRAASELTLPTSIDAMDRWTYDVLLADPALADRARSWYDPYVGTGQWYTPSEVQLVLLPTPRQWLAPGWTNYFGAGDRDRQQAWAAAMYRWQQSWGAELVASWDTMLQFVVGRQPAPGEAAWELAGQLKALGGSLQMERWMLAMAVARSEAWFLHDRP